MGEQLFYTAKLQRDLTHNLRYIFKFICKITSVIINFISSHQLSTLINPELTLNCHENVKTELRNC